MPSRRVTTFRLDAELLDGLRALYERVGIPPSESVRRAIKEWLESNEISVRPETAPARRPRSALTPGAEPAVVPPLPPMPADDRQMDPNALVFLNDPIAQRLVVAWETCGGNEAAWFEAAGLLRTDATATRASKSLRANRIVRAGGVVDPMARGYIRSTIAKRLPRSVRS